MKLEMQNLHVTVEGKEILKGINLTLHSGEVHAIMGPNGSGKSTLAHVLMGHPGYQVTKGRILVDGEDIAALKPNERAKRGVFLSFQHPLEIPGVTVENFLRTAYNTVKGESVNVLDFHTKIKTAMAELGIEQTFSRRYLNEGFSGGEKKRMEMLQMRILEPQWIILDETDSGLDIDALKVVAEGISAMRNKERSFLIITHFNRILKHVEPDSVHVLVDGKIVKSGSKELAHEIEARGYEEHK